jgi:hypothetical protein
MLNVIILKLPISAKGRVLISSIYSTDEALWIGGITMHDLSSWC